MSDGEVKDGLGKNDGVSAQAWLGRVLMEPAEKADRSPVFLWLWDRRHQLDRMFKLGLGRRPDWSVVADFIAGEGVRTKTGGRPTAQGVMKAWAAVRKRAADDEPTSGRTKAQFGFVYALTNESLPGWVKIGRTSKDPTKRLAGLNYLRGLTPETPPFELEFFVDSKDHADLEARVHRALAERRHPSMVELFDVPLDEVRAVFAKLARRPVIEPPPPWPWGRPKVLSGRRDSRGKFQRTFGGAAIFGWLYDRYPEMEKRVGSEGFSWPMVSFEIGRALEAVKGKFRPPPPDLVEQIWERVCFSVVRNGWMPLSQRGQGGIDFDRPSSPAGSQTDGDGAGAAFAALRLDAAESCGPIASLPGAGAEVGGVGGGVPGTGPDGSGWEAADAEGSAADLVSGLPGREG